MHQRETNFRQYRRDEPTKERQMTANNEALIACEQCHRQIKVSVEAWQKRAPFPPDGWLTEFNGAWQARYFCPRCMADFADPWLLRETD